MKKVIALVLVLIMAASVVACGTQAETTNDKGVISYG